LPSVAFTGDLNTGIYSPGADQVAISTNGTGRLFVNASGRIGIGGSSAVAPLQINSSATNIYTLFDDGTNARFQVQADTDKSSLISLTTGATATEDIEIRAAQHIFSRSAISESARIDSSGRLLVGTSTSVQVPFSSSTLGDPSSQLASVQQAGATSAQYAYSTTASVAPNLVLARSRGALNTQGLVSNNDTLGRIVFEGSDGQTVGTDSGFIRAAVIAAEVDGTPGNADMPGRLVFSTTTDGAASPTERMRIDNQGRMGFNTAALGGASGAYRFAGNITGSVSSAGILYAPAVQSDSTTNANIFTSIPSTASNGGTPYTITTLRSFLASQDAFNADSTVTNQRGFEVSSALIGATNNYGFYGNLSSATGRWNFYANGAAPNYFAGDVRTNTVVTARTAPANSNVSATATASSLLDGLRTGTPAANIDLTLPTGTDMDAAFQELQTNQSFEWSVINLAAATHVITVLAGTSGHTVVGNMAVNAATSGRFITRKTAANTFISYRIA
jgi:hypothetical protein